MKSKIWTILKILLFTAVFFLLIYYVFISREEEFERLIKLALVWVGVMFAMAKSSSKPSPIILKKYEMAYKEFLEGAFAEDKRSYRKLVEASVYWDRVQFSKANKILDTLLKKCTCTKDYMFVYRWKSLCYARAGRNKSLVRTYRTMLQYDMTNSGVWADLGLTYMKTGKTKEAHEAFLKAIEYNPQNAVAFNNMSIHLFKTGEWEESMQYLLKTMELAPNMYQPMSMAAVISKIYGDEENAEKYCRMYIGMGGDEKKLQAMLALI